MSNLMQLEELGPHTKRGDRVVCVDQAFGCFPPGTVLTVMEARGSVFKFVEEPQSIFIARGFRHLRDPAVEPVELPAPAGTVPVRIAVAVGQTGHAHAEIIVEPDDEKEAIAHAKAQVHSPVDGDHEVCATILTGYAFLPQPPAEVAAHAVEVGG